jgi:hypothetical protein
VLPLTRLARLVKIIFQKLSLEIWYSDMDSWLYDYKEVIFFFQNPADPKVQFDASTYKPWRLVKAKG